MFKGDGFFMFPATPSYLSPLLPLSSCHISSHVFVRSYSLKVLPTSPSLLALSSRGQKVSANFDLARLGRSRNGGSKTIPHLRFPISVDPAPPACCPTIISSEEVSDLQGFSADSEKMCIVSMLNALCLPPPCPAPWRTDLLVWQGRLPLVS